VTTSLEAVSLELAGDHLPIVADGMDARFREAAAGHLQQL
jgi:hypothetical protein